MYQRRITQILVRHCQVGGKIDFRGVLRWNSISCIWYLGYCRGRPGIMDCWFEVMWGDSEGEIWILIWQFFQIHRSYNARQEYFPCSQHDVLLKEREIGGVCQLTYRKSGTKVPFLYFSPSLMIQCPHSFFSFPCSSHLSILYPISVITVWSRSQASKSIASHVPHFAEMRSWTRWNIWQHKRKAGLAPFKRLLCLSKF